jgi:hypothetical protein
MLQASANKELFEVSRDMLGEETAYLDQMRLQLRPMALDNLIKQCLLWAMAFIGDVTKGILAWRKHTASTPTLADLKSYKVE